mmetsp:Transcript_7159/g.27403  ORF Transcript_7159/g.27403 Transcript_7159/m.27403 type:complete len:576 (-) Transcript_7159:75-1802(-)
MAWCSCEGFRRWWTYAKHAVKRRSGGAERGLAEQDAVRVAPSTFVSGHGVDVAFEMMGMGYLHWGMFVIGGLSMMADGVEIGFVSYVGEAVGQAWDLSALEKAALASVVFVGEFLGSLCFGVLGDRMGRQKAFMISNGMVLTFGLLTRLATNLTGLMILRFFVGFGVGGIVIPFDLFMELLTDDVRGRMLSMYMLYWPLGSIFVAGAAWLILPNRPIDEGWRDLAVVACMPFVIPFFCSFILPESPKWYVAHKRFDDAKTEIEALARLNGVEESEIPTIVAEVLRVSTATSHNEAASEEEKRSQPKPDTSAPTTSVIAVTTGEEDEGSAEDNIGTLFTSEYKARTIPINYSWFAFGFGYYGGQLFFQDLFASSSDDDDELNLNYGAAMLGASFEVVGTLIPILFLDTLGRVFSVSFGHTAASIAFFVLMFAISNAKEQDVSICFAVGARMFITTASVSQWVFTPELYPTSIRATGHALCSMSNRVGAILSPLVAAGVEEAEMAGIFAAITLAAAITVGASLRGYEPPKPQRSTPLCPVRFGRIEVSTGRGAHSLDPEDNVEVMSALIERETAFVE